MFNFINALFKGTQNEDLTELLKNNAYIVDVRTPSEFAAKHVKGAVNIPLEQLSTNLKKFKDKKNIIVYCRSGNRSEHAKSILEANGISGVVNGGALETVLSYF